VKRKIGLALLVGSVGYAAWAFFYAPKEGTGSQARIDNFVKSTVVPSSVVAGIGAYLVWG